VPAEPAIPAALLERLGLAEAPVRGTVVDLAAARQAQALRQTASSRPSPLGRNPFLKIAAQVAIIAGLGVSLAVLGVPGQQVPGSASYSGPDAGPDSGPDPAADYRVLGAAPDLAAPEANALVKFAPGIAAGEADRIAAAAGLRLLGAPSAAGAWKAAVVPGRRDAVLEALRADRRVELAEPIDGGTP
jgi:hypothetical protein